MINCKSNNLVSEWKCQAGLKKVSFGCETITNFANVPLYFTLQLSMGIVIKVMKSCGLTLMKYTVFPAYFKL